MKIVEKDLILAGQYLITDPCYVIPDDKWDDFCDLLSPDSTPVIIQDDEGREFIVANTSWGDGVYPVIIKGKCIGSFCVDAGLFAFISGNNLSYKDPGYQSHLGVEVELHGKLKIEKGNAYLNGKLLVDTRGDSCDDLEDESV